LRFGKKFAVVKTCKKKTPKMTDFVKNLKDLEKSHLDYKFLRTQMTNYMIEKNIMFLAVNEDPKHGPYWVLTKHTKQPWLTDEHNRVFWNHYLKNTELPSSERFVEDQREFLQRMNVRSIKLEKVDHLGLTRMYTVQELQDWVLYGD
jgi:hypothetical protein